MKTFFSKVNRRHLHLAISIVLILGYFYPFQPYVNNSVRIGFPFRFLTLYQNFDTSFNLFSSCYFHIGNFIANVLILYTILHWINKLSHTWIQHKKISSREKT